MKVLKYILIVIAAIIALFLIIGLFAPKKVVVTRSININAMPEATIAQIKSLKNSNTWSPWSAYDPNMKIEYSGTDGEVGSSSKWSGNDSVGSGIQTIKAISDTSVDIDLLFMEPYESKAEIHFGIVPENEGTNVSWSMISHMPYPINAMCIFMDMDGMIGKDFETGLKNLKVLLETTTSYDIHEMDMETKSYVIKRENIDFKDIEKFYGENYGGIYQALQKSNIQPTGAASGIIYKWDEKAMKTDMAAAVPVADGNVKVKGYETVTISAGKVIHLPYHGGYEKMEEAHMAIGKYMTEKNLEFKDVVIEEYVAGPGTEKDTTKWLTNIYYRIK